MTEIIKLAALFDELELIEKDAAFGKKLKAGVLAASLMLGGAGAKSLAARGASVAPSKMARIAKTVKAHGAQSRVAQRIGARSHEMAGVMP